jgi:hypothetical protein
LVVACTVQLSNQTSIEHATAGSVPAIKVLRLSQGCLCHIVVRANKKRALEKCFPELFRGDFLPQTPPNVAVFTGESGSSPASLRWLFSEFKRSILDYQATATGSFALLRFCFGFSASATASAFSASSTSACSTSVASASGSVSSAGSMSVDAEDEPFPAFLHESAADNIVFEHFQCLAVYR